MPTNSSPIIESASDNWSRHDLACREGTTFYEDVDTGFLVFTEVGLRERERCCGSGCRHCPYSHENVPTEKRSDRIQQPSWLTDVRPDEELSDVLFWSGGKDSFLTWLALEREGRRNVVLLTTFDARERRVAHQEVLLDQIVRQAKHLALPLLGVPLHPGREYQQAMESALRLVPRPGRLVFGDLHLEHIRSWREQAFESISERFGTPLSFPLWQAETEELMGHLEASGVPCEITAVTPDALGAVREGDRFDRDLMERLPEGVDRFGEKGEFHTLAKVWEADSLP